MPKLLLHNMRAFSQAWLVRLKEKFALLTLLGP
jgi:hypothetical protein